MSSIRGCDSESWVARKDTSTSSLIVGLSSGRAAGWSKFVFGDHPIGQRGDPIDYRKGHGVAMGGVMDELVKYLRVRLAGVN